MSEITLLDGGMGQELIRRSGNPASPLWSTQVMIDKPGLVAEIHRDYAKAGATVATANTYAIHRDRLRGGESNHYAADGIETADLEDQFEALLNAAVDEADAVKDSGRIAGSIGPLKASYRPDLHPEPSIAVPTFAEIAKLLASRVDIILFETVPSISAARDALVAGRQTDKPVWIAVTIDDEDGSRLRSGERLVDVVPIVRDADAALVNCCAPEIVSTGLDCLQAAGIPLGAYANAPTNYVAENEDLVAAFLDVTAEANQMWNEGGPMAQAVMLPVISKDAGMSEADTASTMSTFIFPSVDDQLSDKWLGGGAQDFMKGVADVFVGAGSIDAAKASYVDNVNTGPLSN